MFLFVKQTAMRGRSVVPCTLLRIRQRRSCFSFCFFSILMLSYDHGFCRNPNNLNKVPAARAGPVNMSTCPPKANLLLNGLAFLALDHFIRVTHALTLV